MDWLLPHSLEDRLFVVIVALVFSPLISLIFHRPPRRLMAFLRGIENKLNRDRRSAAALVYRGIIALGFCLLLMVIFALGFNQLWDGYWRYGVYVEMLLVAWVLPVYRRRQPLGHADAHAAIRWGISKLATQFLALVALVIAYLSGGMFALLILALLRIAQPIFAPQGKQHLAFGWSTLYLQQLLLWVPSRICALLIMFAACFVPRCKPVRAIMCASRNSRALYPASRSLAIAAFAGALHITLGGPNALGEKEAWIGKGSAQLRPKDLRRAQLLYALSVFWLLLVVCLGFLGYSYSASKLTL